ncbi:fibrous sheath CABYR-binding protein-like [Helianthus annuus]|uniref:fibrous sheath CABYR-binding protein-like n=1 Tax=Helianthus annuus TaxID=4232 RepID=UPI000B8F3484|nr:fibrous sheath CABYR-binding protein-like [Helianthus annuus]
MSSSSESGVADTIDLMAIVSDDEIATDPEVFTSDTTSSDDDDFQPFALPDFGDDIPIADGFHDGDLLLVPIPAPFPLAAFPLEDLPLDDMFDDDIDLFIEEIPVDDDVVVPLVEIPVADIIDVPLVEIPAVEISSDHSGPDSFESPPFEAPIIPDDQLFDIPADLEYVPADPEPEIVPEPIPAHDPLPVHDPIPTDVPISAPPLPDPIPVLVDRAPFATHVDPRYAHTRNGWIEDDSDYPPFVRPVTPPPASTQAPVDIAPFHPHESDIHPTDLPVTFLQDILPPHPGEGQSRQQPSQIPSVSATDHFMPQFTHTAPSSAPTGEPQIWFPPNVMPISDPYHPFHIGYSRDELLLSLQLQQEILCRRVMELERIPRPPPCHCQSPFTTPPAPLLPYPDFDVRFLTME